MWAAILRSCLVSLPQSGEAETEVAAASRASQVPAFGSKTYHSRALCRCRRYDRRLLDSGVPRRLGLFVDRINIMTRAYAAIGLACHAAGACVFDGIFVGLILLAGNTHERLTLQLESQAELTLGGHNRSGRSFARWERVTSY